MTRPKLFRGIGPDVARADISGVRLLALAALALLGGGPGTQTITGTITANSGTSLTVSSSDRSLTCAVTYVKGQAVILKWGTGVRVAMGCKRSDGKLALTRLVRLGTTEKQQPSEPAPTTPTTTETTTTTAPAPERRTAIGLVSDLSPTSVTVGDLTCSITAAADAQAAATKLALGRKVGIVCRADGGRWVLAGSTTG